MEQDATAISHCGRGLLLATAVAVNAGWRLKALWPGGLSAGKPHPKGKQKGLQTTTPRGLSIVDFKLMFWDWTVLFLSPSCVTKSFFPASVVFFVFRDIFHTSDCYMGCCAAVWVFIPSLVKQFAELLLLLLLPGKDNHVKSSSTQGCPHRIEDRNKSNSS